MIDHVEPVYKAHWFWNAVLAALGVPTFILAVIGLYSLINSKEALQVESTFQDFTFPPVSTEIDKELQYLNYNKYVVLGITNRTNEDVKSVKVRFSTKSKGKAVIEQAGQKHKQIDINGVIDIGTMSPAEYVKVSIWTGEMFLYDPIQITHSKGFSEALSDHVSRQRLLEFGAKWFFRLSIILGITVLFAVVALPWILRRVRRVLELSIPNPPST